MSTEITSQQRLKSVGLAAAHLELKTTTACHASLKQGQCSLTTRDVALDTSASACAKASSSGGSDIDSSASSRPSRLGRVLRVTCDDRQQQHNMQRVTIASSSTTCNV
jgi:hypothetical protein